MDNLYSFSIGDGERTWQFALFQLEDTEPDQNDARCAACSADIGNKAAAAFLIGEATGQFDPLTLYADAKHADRLIGAMELFKYRMPKESESEDDPVAYIREELVSCGILEDCIG